jgi:O-antigen ligase
MSRAGASPRISAKAHFWPSTIPTSSSWTALPNKQRATILTLLFLFALGGLLVAIYPSATAIGLVTGAALLAFLIRMKRAGMKPWQVLTLSSLTCYVVLNYGFENLSIPLGVLRFLPVGELLMAAALTLAVLRYRGPALREALQDPPVLCILALLLLSIFHLAVDLPEYGWYALRDSTFSFEALFLLLGMIWAMKKGNIELLAKWLLFLFIVSTVYSYTYPWASQLQDSLPASGPFHAVPLLGSYQDIAVYLLSGALFCIWVAPYLVTWPKWVFGTLAVAQLASLGILQSRAMYVGIGLVLVLLLFLRETRPLSQFLSTLAKALGALVLAILLFSVGGWKIEGRLGTMDLSSLTMEVKSIWPSSAESHALGHESDRRAWYGEVWDRALSSPTHLLLGVGYGQPLVDFIADTGQPIRQPHNSTLNVFGRLGVIGLSFWLLLLSIVFRRLWKAAHQARRLAGVSCPFNLWLLAFAVLGLLDSMVQPYFEFSHSAVPYFFIVGAALGMNHKEIAEQSSLAPAQGMVNQASAYRDSQRTLTW